ncbi:MAG: flagellar protein FlaG [Thermodesulfobacteria bacterium]|nr:flagellar protein FlaG [Thermodesulfobacteriota bacterium]
MQVGEVVNRINETPMTQTGMKQEGARSPTAFSKKEAGNPPASSPEQQDPQNLKEMIGAVQEELERLNVRLVFNVDEKTGEIVVQVVDPKTNEVIRQIPPEELLRIREKLDELVGILFEARV